jgi:hypothetical protein
VSAQVQLLRARPVTPAAVAPVQPAPWGLGPSSEPQITLSPQSPSTGRETSGILFMVVGTGGTFARVYLRDPASSLWGLLPSPAFALLQWQTVTFFGAAELYFATDAQPLNGQAPLVFVQETG